MAVTKIQLTGFKELETKLRNLGPRIAKHGLRAANFAGTKVIREATKEYAVKGGQHPQKYLGFLVANIVAPRRKTVETTAKHSVVVRGTTLTKVAVRRRATKRGPKGKYRAVAGPAIYGRFLEFGTSKMRAYPFMTPAFFNNVDAAIDAIRSSLQITIEKELRKRGGP